MAAVLDKGGRAKIFLIMNLNSNLLKMHMWTEPSTICLSKYNFVFLFSESRSQEDGKTTAPSDFPEKMRLE